MVYSVPIHSMPPVLMFTLWTNQINKNSITEQYKKQLKSKEQNVRNNQNTLKKHTHKSCIVFCAVIFKSTDNSEIKMLDKCNWK